MSPCFCVALLASAVSQSTSNPLISSRIERRLVKSFDFDETRLGNFESTPMNWARHIASGFPRYLRGEFDRTFGHDAAPSLRLSLMGGNVGTVYEGRDIPVHPRSDYRIVAWVRPDRLNRARAYVTACYLDRAMQKIAASERRSAPIGGNDDSAWHQVVIDLPGGIEDARWIGLGCWILQAKTPDQPRPIRIEDMSGGAWFDDIAVLRLPRTDITTNFAQRGDGVYRPHDRFEIGVHVVDPDGVGIRADISVEDADGVRQFSQAVPISTDDHDATRVDLSELGPGWYRARLGIYAEQRLLIERQAALIRLAPDLPGASQRGIVGMSLMDWSHQPWGIVRSLLQLTGASSVKIPFWSAEVTASDLVDGNPDMDRALHDLQADGTHVIAVLEEAPRVLSVQYDPSKRTLLDILSSPAARWRPYLSLLIARYASTVTAWQIGRDGDDNLLADPRAAAAVAQVRREVETLACAQAMAVPMGVLHPSRLATAPGALVSVGVASRTPTDYLPEQLAAFLGTGRKDLWTTLSPNDKPYDTRHRLADLARRMALSRVAGSGLIFVPQPWSVDQDGTISVRPEFAVVRTLSQALSGTTECVELPTGADLHAWLFGRPDGTGTVIAWRDTDDDGEATLDVAGGARTNACDILGRPLPRPKNAAGIGSAGQMTYAVGFSPVILAGVDAPRVRTQASMRLAQSQLKCAGGDQETAVVLTNGLSREAHGRLTLRPPAGWRIKPGVIDVSLEAGASGRFPVTVRLPTNVGAGPQSIHARLELDGVPREAIDARLPIEVVSDELKFDAWVEVDRSRIVVHQRLTNRSPAPLDLRIVTVVPGRPRTWQLVRRLAPGGTIQRREEIDRADQLLGKSLRIGIEQVGGPLRHNLVLPIG